MWKPTNVPVNPGQAIPVSPPAHTARAPQTAATASEKNEDSRAAGEPRRVNVIFSAPQYQLLKDLAVRQGINVSDVLRQALSLTKLIVDADENPDERILIERKGELQELRLVR
ncbi:MAG: hypothetical protein WBC78_10790 [Candidatus Sulfotelmatobacter sp.]